MNGTVKTQLHNFMTDIVSSSLSAECISCLITTHVYKLIEEGTDNNNVRPVKAVVHAEIKAHIWSVSRDEGRYVSLKGLGLD